MLLVSVAVYVSVLRVWYAAAEGCGCVYAPRHDAADGTQLQCVQTTKTPVTA